MVFTTQIFVFYFLPLTLAVYYLLPARWRNVFLTLASYVFYGWWNPWFVSLMLASTVIDWIAGVFLTKPGLPQPKRRLALTVALLSNLALLGFFKYFMFAGENLNVLITLLGGTALPIMEVVLPIGISFYTLQSMSYSIDLYRGTAKRAHRFGDFACYVAMFPQLIAGPIVRYREIADQLHDRPQRAQLFHEGALVFMIGFAKKILLANWLAEVADVTFAAGSMDPHVAWFGAVAYTFQAYFDFSGYSDMAIGLGLMMGFRLPINFRSPYKAVSVSDIWRRWHISLGAWVRDYLYIPLGGSRGGRWKTYRNLFISLLIMGIWHGAQWKYVVFWIIQGGLVIVERMTGKNSLYAGAPKFVQIFLTYMIWTVCLVLFRHTDVASACHYWSAMFAGIGDADAAAVTAGRVYQPFYLVGMVVAAIVTWAGRETSTLVETKMDRPWFSVFVFGIFLLSIAAMFAQAENPFIYFQF